MGARWKLHCAYRPQSSGQVERKNRTLKETLTKLVAETGGDWVPLFPFALYRVRNSPYQLGLTPFEIMYGIPPPIIPNLKAEVLKEIDDQKLLFCLRSLQYSHRDTWKRLKVLYESSPPPEPHRYQPGDWVYVCRHHQETLEPRWKGPFLVLMTPTALSKLTASLLGSTTPTHGLQTCSPYEKSSSPQWKAKLDKTNPLKLKLQRQQK